MNSFRCCEVYPANPNCPITSSLTSSSIMSHFFSSNLDPTMKLNLVPKSNLVNLEISKNILFKSSTPNLSAIASFNKTLSSTSFQTF